MLEKVELENRMQEQLEKRLQELKAEFEGGQKKLHDLEAQATALRSTLLRISGAIQVLEEELGKSKDDSDKPVRQPDLKQEEVTEPIAEESAKLGAV